MSKDIKKALEHCVDWDCGNCPNRDELGSGETVCRGRLLPEVLGYVSDLEAKLSESKKQCQQCKHLNKKIELNIKNKLMAENCELQKQLTDKEQENERLKEEICKYEITLMDKNSQLKKQHQDKISFAIAELEKAKEWCEDNCDEMEDAEVPEYKVKIIGLDKPCYVSEISFYDFLDNQINVLRNNKDGIH